MLRTRSIKIVNFNQTLQTLSVSSTQYQEQKNRMKWHKYILEKNDI